MTRDGAPLVMFFYGTLKRGERNHDAYCPGAAWIEEATVRGRLYDLPAGYPALVVPEEDVHAVGTHDHSQDTAVAHRQGAARATTSGGPRVFGELFSFHDPEARLPALDLLEGFVPGDPSSPYRRVLVPAFGRQGATRLAWAYVVRSPAGRQLPAGRWPAG